MNHEYTTIFVVRHEAGSDEQAIAHRNDGDRALKALGLEVRAADTQPGDGWLGAGIELVTGDPDD